jgi:hypothetical protein
MCFLKSLNYFFSLLITQARSRNNQLQLYDKNWATYEIMKTIIKNKRNYRTKIGRPTTSDAQEWNLVARNDRVQPTASTSALAVRDNEFEANNDIFSNSDDGNNGDSDADEERAGSAGPVAAGTKRKATENGGKGKQRKV